MHASTFLLILLLGSSAMAVERPPVVNFGMGTPPVDPRQQGGPNRGAPLTIDELLAMLRSLPMGGEDLRSLGKQVQSGAITQDEFRERAFPGMTGPRPSTAPRPVFPPRPR